MIIEYAKNNFDREAWAAIDRREPFQLIVRGGKRKALKRALAFYQEYSEARRRREKKRSTWLKFGFYGFRMPAFWGIYNHAEIAGMSISSEEREDCFVVAFLPPSSKMATASPSSSLH